MSGAAAASPPFVGDPARAWQGLVQACRPHGSMRPHGLSQAQAGGASQQGHSRVVWPPRHATRTGAWHGGHAVMAAGLASTAAAAACGGALRNGILVPCKRQPHVQPTTQRRGLAAWYPVVVDLRSSALHSMA